MREVLEAIKDDSPLASPNVPITPDGPLGKRSRRDSSSNEDDDSSLVSEEAPVAASAGCYEDLDFLEEDLLQNHEASGTGYVGRESPINWLQVLHDRMEGSGIRRRKEKKVSSEAVTAESDMDTDARTNSRRKSSRTGCFNFYLDSSDIHLEVGDPDVAPCSDTAQKLYRHYQSAVHSPFRILGDSFVAQLRTFYFVISSGGMLPTCAKWKANMNLVFAIGARYAQLTNDDAAYADDDV